MTPKKNPKADLLKKRGLFFQIGMAVALGAVVAVFASAEESRPQMKFDALSDPVDDVPVIMPVRVEQQAARPATAPRVEISDIMNLLDNPDPIDIEDPDWFPEDDPMVMPGPISGRPGGAGAMEDGDPEGDIYLCVSQMPKFMGGDIQKFRQWLADKLSYPAEARRAGVYGVVMVTFVIEANGSLSGIEILDAPHPSLAAEVENVIAKSPKWEPGRQQSLKVRVRYNLPVEFSAPASYW